VEAGEIRRGSLGISLDDATPDVVRELKTALWSSGSSRGRRER